MKELQAAFKNVENERNALGAENFELKRSIAELEKYNEELRKELSQQKAELFSVQLELHGIQTSKTHLTDKINQLQQEIREKQTLIDNLLISSKETSSSLSLQILQLREELTRQERRYESRLSEKGEEVLQMESTLTERDSLIRTLEAEKKVLHQRMQSMTRRDRDDVGRDKEIEYLNEQIKSLQQFLSDITTQYRELEYKYQQEKYSSHNRSFSLKSSRNVIRDRSNSQRKEHQERWKARENILMDELTKLDTSGERLNRSRGDALSANEGEMNT